MGYSKLTYEEYIEHPEQWGTELPLWAKELSEMGYPGVSAIDFYDDIFGEDLEEERLPEEYVRCEYAGITNWCDHTEIFGMIDQIIKLHISPGNCIPLTYILLLALFV